MMSDLKDQKDKRIYKKHGSKTVIVTSNAKDMKLKIVLFEILFLSPAKKLI